MSEKAIGNFNSKGRGIGNWLAKNVFYIFIVLIQIIILYLLVNPINLFNQLDTVSVINRVSKKITSPPGLPTAIGRVGDKVTLLSADELRKGNAFDAIVYKDAKDGDYVIGYQGKTIIYRKSEDKVIYNDKSAQTLLQESQQNLVSIVIKKSQDAGIVPKENISAPAVSVVTDAESVKKLNDFYSIVEKDDIIAQFSKPDVVVIYRPSQDKIVKSGNFALVIK